VVVSADGSRVYSGSLDKSIRVWNTATGQQLATLQSHTDHISSLALCGSLLVSGSWDKSVKLWDTANGQLLRTLQGHENYVTSVAVTSDGGRVVSGSPDNSVRVWTLLLARSLHALICTLAYIPQQQAAKVPWQLADPGATLNVLCGILLPTASVPLRMGILNQCWLYCFFDSAASLVVSVCTLACHSVRTLEQRVSVFVPLTSHVLLNIGSHACCFCSIGSMRSASIFALSVHH
jgi:hypothetical protein